MSILDNIYRQGQTVGKELKGMNAALGQMQKNDKQIWVWIYAVVVRFWKR